MAKGDEMVFDMDGQKISGKAWGSPASGHNVLLLHGWLDNVGSWYPLAEELSQSGCYLVAIDLPGHGQSQVCGSTFPLLLK
jgi:alpha-beta hydrolase superfamily lysophospholipase